MGCLLQRTDNGKPIQIHNWSSSLISRWKPVLWFVAAIGFPLLTDSGNWPTANNLFELQRDAYSRCRHNSGKPISAISWLAAEIGFLLFKEQVPLKFTIEISAAHCERKTFLLISLLSPVSFRWTVPSKEKIGHTLASIFRSFWS
jgi:hypothetical protein